MDGGSFDYVVIGAGSAGCVVASRLAEDPDLRVLILEAGEPAENHPETGRADGYKDAFLNEALMHDRFSVPQANCGKQRLFMGSGRGVGGSGSINGMVYTRGARQDYDQWPEGWRWDDVVPHFEALEARLNPHRRPPTRFTEAALAAAAEVDFRVEDDLNNGDLSGVFGAEWMNYDGEARRSSYVSFLEPSLRQGNNLVLRTSVTVLRIVFEGTRAVGVEYSHDGQTRHARAASEVVLCAGALESARLLLLSGVGPRRDLEELGIPVVHDSPQVGRNLHDHPNVSLFFKGKQPVDCNYPQLYGFDRVNRELPLPERQSDTCFVFYPARSSLREAAMRLVPALVLPPSLYRVGFLRRGLRRLLGLALGLSPARRFIERLWGVVLILGKPVSRGSLRLRSADPRHAAVLDPAYFTDDRDMTTMLAGVARARALAGAPSLRRWGNQEISPGAGKNGEASLRRWIEAKAMTTYHYAGTCRMGHDDEAVVTPELRVRGLQGLTVADASVVPFTPVSAMNAPSMLVGHRAADWLRMRRAQPDQEDTHAA